MEIESTPSYRSKLEVSSSDSDSDNSEKDFVWKRGKRSRPPVDEASKLPETSPAAITDVRPNASASQSLPVSRKRKANSIWCTVLEDQIMSETFKDCGLRAKPPNAAERTCESYDYTLKYSDPRNEQLQDGHVSSDDRMSDDTDCSKQNPVKRQKTGSGKYVKLDKDGIAAAQKIVRVLNEPKKYLIFRVIKAIGQEKAMKLLKMTEEIEENGGMMIKNNARRRTPGGIYFQLLKADKSVTKEQIDEIFEGEHNSYEMQKIYRELRKRKQELKKNKKIELMDLNAVSDSPSETILQDQIEDEKPPENETPPANISLNTPPTVTFDLEEGEIED